MSFNNILLQLKQTRFYVVSIMSKCSGCTQHSNKEDLALGIPIHKGAPRSKYSVIYRIKGNVWKNCFVQPQDIKSSFIKLLKLSFRYLPRYIHTVWQKNILP